MPEAFVPNANPPTDSRTPLIRFKGVLKQYQGEVRHDDTRNRDFHMVVFDFTDVEVLETSEPYPFPIAKIEISFSDRADTRWAAFTKSFRSTCGSQGGSLDPLVGKKQEWHQGPCLLRQPVMDEEGNPVEEKGRPKWANQPSTSWQVVSVEGFANAANNGKFNDILLDLINGKTEEEFTQALFNQSELKAYGTEFTDTVNRQIKRELLPMLEVAGLIKKSTEGVWSKV